MNINVIYKKLEKICRKNKVVPTKVPVHHLLNNLDFKNWHPIKVETKPFDQND